MEVQMGRREPSAGDGIDLGAELKFDLIEPSLAEQGRPADSSGRDEGEVDVPQHELQHRLPGYIDV
ncbi:hypothetical protein AMK12_18600 [Streptomyces sp. TSRI0395]|nr:hypothetical protein AMK12_18600 [Streptomyces sp. TSRI0395]